MVQPDDMIEHDDPFNLQRFIIAQEGIYQHVLIELSRGQKQTHWMWFIFPQVEGLGFSATTQFYAIKSSAEASAYLHHPVLGKRLRECTQAILAIEGRSISEILGYPDDLKLKSSMTLFASVAEQGSLFARVLDRYYQGKFDDRTILLLAKANEKNR